MAANTMLGLLVCGELTICQPVALECHQIPSKGALPDPLRVWVPVQSNQTQANIFGVMDRLTELHMSVLVQATEAGPSSPIPMQISRKTRGGPNQATRACDILTCLRQPTDEDDFYLAKVLQIEAHGASSGAATGGCIVPACNCTWQRCTCYLYAGLIGSLVVSGMDLQVDSSGRFTTLVIADQYKVKAVWAPILRKLVKQNPGFSFCICTAKDRKGGIQWEKTSVPATTNETNQYHSLYIIELPNITKTIIRKLNSSLQLGDDSPVPMTVDRLVWDTVCAHHKSPGVLKGSDCVDVFDSWQTPIGSRIQWTILPINSVAYCMTRGRESKLRLLSSIGFDADSRRIFDTESHVAFNLTDTFVQAPLKCDAKTNVNRKLQHRPTISNEAEISRNLRAKNLDMLADAQENMRSEFREQFKAGSRFVRSSYRYQFIQTANATLNKLKCKQSLFSHEMSDVEIFDAAVLLARDPSHRRLLYTKTGKIGGALHARHLLQLAAGVNIMHIPGAKSILAELEKVGSAFCNITHMGIYMSSYQLDPRI
jgi:hypothetical protein